MPNKAAYRFLLRAMSGNSATWSMSAPTPVNGRAGCSIALRRRNWSSLSRFRTRLLLCRKNSDMPQYDGGSWFGDVHEILTRDFGFFLGNTSQAQVLNGRASMCDGLYVNPNLVREWVKPDFV